MDCSRGRAMMAGRSRNSKLSNLRLELTAQKTPPLNRGVRRQCRCDAEEIGYLDIGRRFEQDV